MGGTESKPKPSAVILAPKVFDFPPAAARTRMSTPAYDLMFEKLSLRALFDDYFQRQPGRNVEAGLVFKPPLYDANVDLTATMFKDGGEALMRWQRDSDDPHNFLEVLAPTSKSMLRLRTAAHYPTIGIGAFGTFPLLMANRACSEDYGVMGLRYVSQNFLVRCHMVHGWLGEKGISAQACNTNHLDTNRWKQPSYAFYSLEELECCSQLWHRLDNSILLALELVRNTQLVASVYQHNILRKEVYERRGGDRITGCLSYLDFGLELATRVNEDKTMDNVDKSLFQIAASWQVSENFLVKGKACPSKSSAALALKLPPCFTFSVTVENDHPKGTRSYGFGIHAGDDVIDPGLHRTINSNWTVLTETKGEQEKRTFQFDRNSGDFENLPTELKPVDEIL